MNSPDEEDDEEVPDDCVDTDCSVPARVRGAGGPKGWWRLIWCQERCHKSEREAQRQLIHAQVAARGGALISFKKARQLGRWVERAPRPPFVLVTDWREAQPCLQAIATHAHQNSPCLTVVLCASGRQFNRAIAWRQTLGPEVGEIYVCEERDVQQDLLGGLVAACFGAPHDTSAAGIAEVPPPTGTHASGGVPPARSASALGGSSPTGSVSA